LHGGYPVFQATTPILEPYQIAVNGLLLEVDNIREANFQAMVELGLKNLSIFS